MVDIRKSFGDRTIEAPNRRRFFQRAMHLFGSGAAGVALLACAAPTPTAVPRQEAARPAEPTPAPKPAAAATPAAPKPAPTQAPPKPKVLVKWRHLEPTRAASSAFRVMVSEKGFDREMGIDAEIISISGGGTTQIKALVAGEAESAEPGFPPITPSIESGAEMKLLGAFIPGAPMAFYVRKEIKDLRDLYGKTVGISGVGALFHQLTKMLMLEAGLDPERVTYVNVGGGSPANFQAVTVGKIDAGVASSDFIRTVPEFPDTKVLFRIPERLPKFVYEGFIASDKAIKDRPEQLMNFLIAYARGQRYAIDHSDETAALAAKLTGRDLTDSKWEVERYPEWKLNNPNFDIPEENLRYMQEAAVRLGDQKAVLPLEKVADFSFQKKLIAQLGPYRRP